MTIEFYTNGGLAGLELRRWTCRKCDFDGAVSTARAALADGRPGALIRLDVAEPFRGLSQLHLDAEALVAYADGGNPPIGEL